MRFVFGLILGMALGLSAALLAAPQRGSETIHILRERAQQWHGEADSDEGDSGDA
jgi:gas vesicle protein